MNFNNLISQNNKLVIVILNFAIPFLMGTGIDLYVPSLPEITHYFGTIDSLVKLTVGFYLLGFGCSQPFFGALSDSYGRRKILLITIFTFFITSLFTVIAPDIYTFLALRLFQGIAIGGVGLVINALLTDSFSGIALTKMANHMTVSWASGPIIGPFIGGYLQHYFGWQADFYYFALYGLFIFIITFFFLPETNRHPIPFKLSHIVTSYLTVLKNHIFISGILVMTFIYAASIIFNILGPFLIQDLMKYSSIIYGYIGLSMGFAYFLGGLSNRIFINFIAPIRIALYGLVCAVIISILMILVDFSLGTNLLTIAIPTFLFFYCTGLVFPNCLGECLGMFPKNAGAASAVSGLFFGIGTFATSLIATLLKTTNQLPMAITFMFLSIMGLIIYKQYFRFSRRT